MDYTTFKSELTELLKNSLQEDAEITWEKIPKNNGIYLEGLVINEKDSHAAPVIYVQEYYKLYQKGVPLPQLVQKIMWNYKNCNRGIQLTNDFFRSYEPLKPYIFYKLVNYEKNRERLKRIPHRKFLDLAMVFYYQVESENTTASILIQNNHLDLWGVSLEELEENARKYTCISKPAEFLTMAQIAGMEEEEMEELIGKDEFPMYVLTNRQRHLGAGVILYPGVLQQAEELLGGSFYILPSSIHECILVPAEGEFDREELTAMVTEINEEHVEPGEVLSDYAYYYQKEDQSIHM